MSTTTNLPALETPLIQRPDHIVNPFAGRDHAAPHRITLLKGEERWLWAHVLRAVSGWEVISAGVLSRSLFKTADDAGEYLVRQFLGADGDGFDRLSREAYLQKGRIAHIRCEGEPGTGYCGVTGGPAEFDTRKPGHAEQHCIECDRAYQAEHYGRTAVPC